MMTQPQTIEILARSSGLVAAYREHYEPFLAGPLSDIVRIEDPAFHVNPWPTYQRLQREAPVYWYDKYNTWLLTRHEDVSLAAKAPETLSSARGILLFDGVKSDSGL